MKKINLETLFNIFNNQKQNFGGVNKQLFCDYLDFRETQWKKCNTTLEKMLEDNKAQHFMLSRGNIHMKMFYRSIQFAIYHEINTLMLNQQKLDKTQKIANLPKEINYFETCEISKILSKKLGIDFCPSGLFKLTEMYLSHKRLENISKYRKNVSKLDTFKINKSQAKDHELILDTRLVSEEKISLKILHLSIQYLCEHILKNCIFVLNEFINFNIDSINLNSCHYMRRDYQITFSLDYVAILFSYYLQELTEEEEEDYEF